jgi:hypothetical protein
VVLSSLMCNDARREKKNPETACGSPAGRL